MLTHSAKVIDNVVLLATNIKTLINQYIINKSNQTCPQNVHISILMFG